MKIRKGDTVKIIAGGNSKKNQDKGKVGEVLDVNLKKNTVVVQGVNIVVKHHKPTQQHPEGNIETKEAPIDASNVAYYDNKEKKIVKIGYKFVEGKKVRVDKKTGIPLEKKVAKKVAKAEKKKVDKKKTSSKKTSKVKEG
ncbi:50S ribosomal protein L24 [bacterium]|jgi:large subunit ribosomal protein L24|nr:50S ribosomal protein L24 [bacterium]